MSYDIEKVLATYRSKKTAEIRRDVIRDAAKEYGVPVSQIAGDLLRLGEKVDGRLLKIRSGRPRFETTRPEAPPPAEMPAPAEEEDREDSEPEPEQETAPGCMTVGTLRQLLDGVVPDGEILFDGDAVTGMEISAMFDADGNRGRCIVMLFAK